MSDADAWYAGRTRWQDALAALREALLGAGLQETFKWRQPCYAHHEANVAIVGDLAAGATVSFFLGALLDDPRGRLETPGENTRAARFLRVRSAADVAEAEADLRAFLTQAKALADAGARVAPPAEAPAWVPELVEAWDADPPLRDAFHALTPGRQRAYNLLLGQAKQPSTRRARLAAFRERILAGRGPHDCTCGLTRRPPGCDGSHKHGGAGR
jgi:uncharacterized protein YdeI (YjbR/CyaY-like superfamily)